MTGRRAALRKRESVRTPSRLKIEHLEERTVPDAGGGLTGAGLTGRYFADVTNPTNWLADMAGYTPAFTRTDVRVDFTDDTSSPGGVPQDGTFASVGSSAFAVQWTGSVIPAYNEIYTFETVTDNGVVLKINGTTIIDDFNSHAPETDTVSLGLTAGATYTIEMDYYHANGASTAELLWQSADTNPTDAGYFAQEAIEPGTPVGVNYELDPKEFADVVKFASYTTATATNPTDGWATQDFTLTLFRGGGEYGLNDQGTYLLQFDGEAQVTDAYGPALDFKVGGKDYGSTLPFGAGFNGTTTTATVTIPDLSVWGQMQLSFTKTQRDGGGGGVTDIHLMRPTTQGGTTDYPVGTLLTSVALAEAAPFTTLRMMDWTATNTNTVADWSNQPTAAADFWDQTGSLGMPWETAVAIANATGKDLYINIPADASDSFITALADLLKYGSNGIDPYTSPQADPVWAPLDSNLNVYIEYSNEVWNWTSPVYAAVNNLVLQNKQDDTANWQLFSSAGGWVNTNASGAATSSDTALWALVMDVDISNIFRQVFGSASMPVDAAGAVTADPRIRPVFEWQYGGGWNGGSDPSATAMTALSAHLPDAIDYYIWGGGGGWYESDTVGGFSDVSFANPNFDSGTADWTFSGGAGIVANGSSAGNPNSPTEVAPSSPAKTTTNAVDLPPGASISQTVYFSGGYADLTFYAAQTAASNGKNGLQITIDGQPIGESEGAPGFSGTKNAWGWSQTAAFDTGAAPGYYTITFTNTWAASSGVNVFLDNLGIQTVNGLFKEEAAAGAPSIATVESDVAIDLEFGLHDVGYEGGFTFAQNLGGDDINGYSDMGVRGYSSLTPNVAMEANLDPRTEQLAQNAIEQFFQDGGAMPIIYQSTGNNNSWGVVPNIYDATTETTTIPKVEAVVAVGEALSPAPTYGAPAGSVAAPPYDWQAPGHRLNETFLIGTAGTYDVGVTINKTNNGSTGTFELLVDGTVIGSISVTDSSAGPYTLPVFLSAGQHSITIVCTAEHSGPFFGLGLADVTAQLVAAAPPSSGSNSADDPSSGSNNAPPPSSGSNSAGDPSSGSNGDGDPSSGSNGDGDPSSGSNNTPPPSSGSNGDSDPSSGSNGDSDPSSGSNGDSDPSSSSNGDSDPSSGSNNQNPPSSSNGTGNTSGGSNNNANPVPPQASTPAVAPATATVQFTGTNDRVGGGNGSITGTYGAPITYTVQVTGGGGTPTGTVTFYNASTGAVLGTANLDGNGYAQLTTAEVSSGTNTIRAAYSGDSTYRSGSGTVKQVITGVPLYAAGSGPNGPGIVTVYGAVTGGALISFAPFGAYAGGVKVAVGDVNGDGYDDLIVMAGPGALNGLVQIYSGKDFSLLSTYFAFPGYTGEFNIAAGDLTGNGIADVIFSTATGGDAVFAYAGSTNNFIVSPFSAFGGFTGGVTVAAGDVLGNGEDQIVVGTASQVGAAGVFNSSGQLLQPYYFAPMPIDGVNVAAADLNGDGRADIIFGAKTGSTLVLEFDGASRGLMGYFSADPGQSFGVNVAAVDPTDDGRADILVGFTGNVSAIALYSGLSFQLMTVDGQPSGAGGFNVASSAGI